MVQHYEYTDTRQIAFAEMAAALKGLIWRMTTLVQEPTTITLFSDSAIVYHTLVKGTGLTLRALSLLQQIFVRMWMLKIKD
jgi:hypothetical protein